MDQSSETPDNTLDGLFVNPITYGRTPEIESYRVATCPVCCELAISMRIEYVAEYPDDGPARYPCTAEYHCQRGHPWRTSWSGESQMIHREAAWR